MPRNTGRGYRRGSIAKRTGVRDPRTGLWTRRDLRTGQFTSSKKATTSTKGDRKKG